MEQPVTRLQKVYFLSGLGADERAFSALDLSFCEPVFLRWLLPEVNESMEHYASRMLGKIPDEQPVIVGLSFGGMLGVEIAKQMTVKKLIIISSAKTFHDIPRWIRNLKYVPLHRLLKANIIKQLDSFAYLLMGVKDRADKVLFRQMFLESDNRIVDWTINAIINWRNETVPARINHIHGTRDIVLPFLLVKADIPIKGGEHLMPLIQPELVSSILKQLIQDSVE